MIFVKVTYTVSSDFAATNKKNVEKFINDIRKLNNPAIRYTSFVSEDGKTFTHMSAFKSEEAQRQFLSLPSFKSFQQERDASGLEFSATVEMLQVAASSYDIFE